MPTLSHSLLLFFLPTLWVANERGANGYGLPVGNPDAKLRAIGYLLGVGNLDAKLEYTAELNGQKVTLPKSKSVGGDGDGDILEVAPDCELQGLETRRKDVFLSVGNSHGRWTALPLPTFARRRDSFTVEGRTWYLVSQLQAVHRVEVRVQWHALTAAEQKYDRLSQSSSEHVPPRATAPAVGPKTILLLLRDCSDRYSYSYLHVAGIGIVFKVDLPCGVNASLPVAGYDMGGLLLFRKDAQHGTVEAAVLPSMGFTHEVSKTGWIINGNGVHVFFGIHYMLWGDTLPMVWGNTHPMEVEETGEDTMSNMSTSSSVESYP